MGNWFSSLPGAIAQGLIWGIMAIGVYITYRILDIADLTVDGSICTGAAVCTVLIMRNINPWLALLCAFLVGLVAGSITGALHIGLGIPAILAGILTQMALWSVNLRFLVRRIRQFRRGRIRCCFPRWTFLRRCSCWGLQRRQLSAYCTCFSAPNWVAASGRPVAILL